MSLRHLTGRVNEKYIWSPRDLGGNRLKMWIDFGDWTTLYQDALQTIYCQSMLDPIKVAQDKLHYPLYVGHPLSASPDERRPEYYPAQVANLASCGKFTSANYSEMGIGGGDVASMTRNKGNITICCVINCTRATDSNYVINFSTPTDANSRAAIAVSSGTIIAGGRRLDSDSFASVNVGSADTNGGHFQSVIASFRWDIAKIDSWLNYTFIGSQDFQTAGLTSDTDQWVANVGTVRYLSGTNYHFEGYIGELLFFDGMLESYEVPLVVKYFENKWGPLW